MKFSVKLIIFEISFLIANITLAFVLKRLLAVPTDLLLSSYALNLALIIFLVSSFFAITLSLLVFFRESITRLLIPIAAGSLLFFLITFSDQLLPPLVLTLVLGVTIAVFSISLILEERERVRFSVRGFFAGPLKNVVNGMLILVSVSFFFSYKAEVAVNGVVLPEVLIEKVVTVTGKTLIDTMVGDVAKNTKLQNENAVYTEIPEEINDAGLQNTLTQEFGVTIDRVPQNSNDLLAMIRPALVRRVRSDLTNFLTPYASIIPALTAVSLFLSLTLFVPFVALIIRFILEIVFIILRCLKITSEETKTIEISRPVI